MEESLRASGGPVETSACPLNAIYFSFLQRALGPAIINCSQATRSFSYYLRHALVYFQLKLKALTAPVKITTTQ